MATKEHKCRCAGCTASAKQATALERDRIIALLEELKEYWSEKAEFEYGTISAINADEAIALIKKEN